MTDGARETVPPGRSRWIDLAVRVQDILRAAGRRRWIRLVGLAILLGGAGWSIAHLDLELAKLSFGLLALNLFVLAPIAVFLSALSLRISARALGREIGATEALHTAALANVAELLPLPGGAMVRYSALVKAGASFRESGGMITLTSVLTLSMTITLSATAFVLMGYVSGVPVLLAGATGVAATLLWMARRVRLGVLVGMVLVRLAMLALTVVRVTVAFATLGTAIGLAMAALLSVAPTLGSAVAIMPAGLGVNESIAAGLAALVASSPSAAFLATALNRALGLAAGAMVATGFSVLQTGSR